MGILGWLGVGKELAEPIKAVGELYTTDRERLDAQARKIEVSEKPRLAQIENNRLMVISGNIFASSWQPLVGWTAGLCVFLYWVPQLLIANLVWAQECLELGTVMPFPILPEDIYNLVWLLFGFAGYHVIKKKLNV